MSLSQKRSGIGRANFRLIIAARHTQSIRLRLLFPNNAFLALFGLGVFLAMKTNWRCRQVIANDTKDLKPKASRSAASHFGVGHGGFWLADHFQLKPLVSIRIDLEQIPGV